MKSAELKDVVAVRHLGGHRIWLRFEDGIEGEIDLRKVVREFSGVLAGLRDPGFVAEVRVHPEFGTITWPGELDLDPVVLYCAVKGIPVPTYDDAPPHRKPKPAAKRTRVRRLSTRGTGVRRRRTGT